jgi:hypothetical protein
MKGECLKTYFQRLQRKNDKNNLCHGVNLRFGLAMLCHKLNYSQLWKEVKNWCRVCPYKHE